MARLASRQLPSRSRAHGKTRTPVKPRSRLQVPVVLALAALVGHLAARVSAANDTAQAAPRQSVQQRSVKALKGPEPPEPKSTPREVEAPVGPRAEGPFVEQAEVEPEVGPTPAEERVDEGPQSSPGDATCPEGMVAVHGEYCPVVAHRCLEYLSEKRDRCAEYAETNRCFGTPESMTFCIDRFEYPNRAGEKPQVGMTYLEAAATCEAEGKRLCSDREWSLACEGNARLPYPHGYKRDPEACNYDKPYIIPNDNAFASAGAREAEMERLDQREPSGERAQCVSQFGVHDMTGNVDEWVLNTAGVPGGKPYVSGLKGGYWGPVRNRCRPMTTDHNEWHDGYQIGFRCCSDLDGGGASTSSEYDEPPVPEGPRAELEQGAEVAPPGAGIFPG